MLRAASFARRGSGAPRGTLARAPVPATPHQRPYLAVVVCPCRTGASSPLPRSARQRPKRAQRARFPPAPPGQRGGLPYQPPQGRFRRSFSGTTAFRDRPPNGLPRDRPPNGLPRDRPPGRPSAAPALEQVRPGIRRLDLFWTISTVLDSDGHLLVTRATRTRTGCCWRSGAARASTPGNARSRC